MFFDICSYDWNEKNTPLQIVTKILLYALLFTNCAIQSLSFWYKRWHCLCPYEFICFFFLLIWPDVGGRNKRKIIQKKQKSKKQKQKKKLKNWQITQTN